MPVAEQSRRRVKVGQIPYNGFTKLHSGVGNQYKEYSQEVRMHEKWSHRVKKNPIPDQTMKQERKNQFFTKFTGSKIVAATDVTVNREQQASQDPRISGNKTKRESAKHPDKIESSYRIFNDLVNKAHERRLEQIEINNKESDFMEFKYDPKTCILVVTLEDATEIAAMLDSGSTYSLISRETIMKSEV
jgi:hypothetical protein